MYRILAIAILFSSLAFIPASSAIAAQGKGNTSTGGKTDRGSCIDLAREKCGAGSARGGSGMKTQACVRAAVQRCRQNGPGAI